MEDAERYRLLGKYSTPRFCVGQRVRCQVRGEMVITGMTDAPIPWPVGKHGAGRHTLIVYKGLAKAIRREANQAVAHWWGIEPQTVTKWRKALSVQRGTRGTTRLFREYTKEPWAVEAFAKAQSKAGDPERCRKIAEARRGKPRPSHVVEAVRQAHLGQPASEETRRRMSETHRRRGTLVPGTVPWTAEQDQLVRTGRRRMRRVEPGGACKRCTRVGVGLVCRTGDSGNNQLAEGVEKRCKLTLPIPTH
jgi:hypothetical protein